MWSDSSKHRNDTDINLPKNILNITHLKKIMKSKFEVSNCEEDLKEIIFTSTTTLKEAQEILNTQHIKLYFENKILTHNKKMIIHKNSFMY